MAVNDLKNTKTNEYMKDKLISHVNGYLKNGMYKTLLLEVAIQDGVVQVIKTIEVNEKKKL